jgi:long-chain fatty acid transport protein
VPNGYLSWQLGSSVWAGVGVNAPFGLETDWEADWVGRFHATKSKVQTLNLNPTLAFKVSEVLSLGVGASYQRLDADLQQVVPYGASVGAAASVPPAFQPAAAAAIIAQLGGPTGLAREGAALIEGDSWAWGWNAGALVELGERGRLAVSYRSKVKHEIEGDVTFQNAPAFQEAGPFAAVFAALNARFANGPVTAEIELPETLSAAAAWENEKVELLADWTWTGWDSIPTLDIVRAGGTELSSVPLRFGSTWRVGLGANVKLNEAWTLRLGTAYDKAPVQDAYRTPRLPDERRTWAAGGFEWKLGAKASLDVGYAHLFVNEASSDLPNQDTPTSTPAGALVGTYKAKVDIAAAQLTLRF